MASPNPFVAGPTGDEHDAEPVEYVHELKHADVPAEPVENTERVGTLDDYLADWWDETTWYDVLHPAGWTRNRPDNCGCQTWTRPHAPGESVTPKSLTAHEVGCQRGRTDALHPAGHVWSDHVDGALADMVTAQGRTLSAFAIYAALHHDGDYAEACRAVGIPARHATSLAHLGTNFDDSELWDAAPWLTRVRDNARYLGVDRYALLLAVLSEVVLRVPPRYVMDNPRPASLNLFVLLVGNPGTGKGVAFDSVGSMVGVGNSLRAQAQVGAPETMKGFTGEGMARAFEQDVDEDGNPKPPRALRFREDEVTALTAKMNDPKSTHLAVLNATFMGEAHGATLADSRRSFHVDAHGGRVALQLAGQPGSVGDLFTGQAEATGFSARLLVADMRIDDDEDTVNAVDPTRVDKTRLTVDYETLHTDPVPGTDLLAIRTDRRIVDELNRARVMRNVKGATLDDTDGHTGLLRRKVATAIALASGASSVDYEHWHLAGYVVDNSRATIAQWRSESAKDRHDREVGEDARKRAVEREGTEREQTAKLDKVVAYIERVAEPIPLTDIHRKGPAGRWKDDREAIYEMLRGDDRVTVSTVRKGNRDVEMVAPAG